MPWTEYFCNFDRFLRGGQDCELGILALLTVCCLVIVLCRQWRNGILLLLALRRGLAFARRLSRACALEAADQLTLWLSTVPLPLAALRLFSQPLRI